MKKTGLLTTLLVLLIISTVWAGDSVTISMSCTIPSIPGVNAPPLVSEKLITNSKREEIAKKNTGATEGEQIIEKQERKESLLAQGEKVTTEVRTIYTR